MLTGTGIAHAFMAGRKQSSLEKFENVLLFCCLKTDHMSVCSPVQMTEMPDSRSSPTVSKYGDLDTLGEQRELQYSAQ